jgi:hypothetical protein
MPSLHQTGSYPGLLTAAFAFYLAAAGLINEARGRVALPDRAGRSPACVSVPAGLTAPRIRASPEPPPDAT